MICISENIKANFFGVGNTNKRKAKEKYNLKSCKHSVSVYMFNSDKKRFSKETTPIRSFNLDKLESHMSSRVIKIFFRVSIQTCYVKRLHSRRNGGIFKCGVATLDLPHK